MTSVKKGLIYALLKGIETGDESSVAVVNEEKYVQHNPQTHEGSLGLAALFKELAKSNPRVNIVRIFEDGDYVFAHTEYDFATSNVGFEIFRFEGEQAVEHWDNIQQRMGPNPSGHTMVDGPTQSIDHGDPESNRDFVKSFVNTILINGEFDKLEFYIGDSYTEHNPHIGDGPLVLRSALMAPSGNERITKKYKKNHRILAEGNFVLSVSEGYIGDVHSSFFDLYRIDQEKLVEHWDTVEAIPPRSEWKNDNGKF